MARDLAHTNLSFPRQTIVCRNSLDINSIIAILFALSENIHPKKLDKIQINFKFYNDLALSLIFDVAFFQVEHKIKITSAP